jgi:uncharacterized membrane protein YkvA (DUF1232 family)
VAKSLGYNAVVFQRATQWARATKRDVVALWIAAQDPRVPWYAKAAAAAVAGYALSPIDLIPDFIPVVGYLDDLLIVPVGILLAVRLVPPELMAEFRDEAAKRERPTSNRGAVAVMLVWAATIIVFIVWMIR